MSLTAAVPHAHLVYPIEYRVRVENSGLESQAKEVFQTHTSSFFEWVHWANENVVLLPFRAFLHCKSYVKQPFPGENKGGSPWRDTGVKAAAFFGGIVMSLPAIPSLVMGLAIRSLEHGYRPFMSYYRNPDLADSPPPVLTQETPLHIGSLNVSLTPSSVNIEMDLRPPLVRAEELACSLVEDPNRPTILFIEEGWHEDALRHLCIRLRGVYPHIIHSVAPHILGMSSGIALFSLYPLESVEYLRFGEMVYTHRLPARGILKICLRTACGTPLYIYGGIHTQSMEGYEYAQSRLYQVRQLAALVTQDAQKNKCMQAIIGDLNTTAIDLHGYDNRGQAEQPVFDAVEASFNDAFLKDHAPITGERISGSPYFLEADNNRMNLALPEPTASWYDGPYLAPEEMQCIQQELDADAKLHHYPNRQPLPGKAVTTRSVWGTPAWFHEQSAQRAR
ncbi:endonuclease/exonuclease/phosphatase family protein, partial [Chlamydiota bacterium]